VASTGSPWNLEYPTLADAPNAPLAIETLADDVHGVLGRAYPCTSGTRPTVADGLTIFETDTGLLYIGSAGTWVQVAYGDDPGTVDAVTAGVTAGANFTLSSGVIQRRNGMVSMYLSMTSNGAITAGNITNQVVCVVPSGYIPRYSHGQLSGGASGPTWNGYVAVTSGNVYMTTLDTSLTVGAAFNVNGLWML
jgi:hypothetical protein